MNRFSMYALGAVLVLGIGAPLLVTNSFAGQDVKIDSKADQGGAVRQGNPPQQGGGFQQGIPGQGGPGAGPRGGFQGPPQGGGMMMGMGGMGGGQATMVVDGNSLYILQGNMLYKVNKDTLKVVATGELPRPQMRMPGGESAPLPGGGGGG